MSQFSNNIYTIHNNIFSLTPILVSFYKNLIAKDKDILLSYFVFPTVLSPIATEEFKRIPVKSNLTRLVANKKFMFGFQSRFEQYKQITNNCLQYAIDCNYLKIRENLSIEALNQDVLYTDNSLASAINLASQLPNVFKLDVINTYYAFGIKGL